MDSLFPDTPLHRGFEALRRDLIHEEGPRISTMRNYRFAIVQYKPDQEFEVRGLVQQLTSDLIANGWVVLPLDLDRLLLERIRAQGEGWLERVIGMEQHLAAVSLERGLGYLRSKLEPLVDGAGGISADCSREILKHAEKHPDKADRTLVLIGRAGALYPFFRSSALLRHLDGKTANLPVVVLYPGERQGPTGLSFMGVLPPDNDYRPRIYP
ncbi:MAG TPA: DUF1788 domain-containing protein [Longimicrobiaceae bacterium]|nr:DUF1788 domain-containing protein [Longimicrobiaceae bacterium]